MSQVFEKRSSVCAAAGCVLAGCLLWCYKDRVDVENGLKLCIFSFHMVLPYYYQQATKMSDMTFGECFLSMLLMVFAPLNNYLYYAQTALHVVDHLMFRVIELDDLYRNNETNIDVLAYKLKQIIVGIMALYGTHACLHKYFFYVSINTQVQDNNPETAENDAKQDAQDAQDAQAETNDSSSARSSIVRDMARNQVVLFNYDKWLTYSVLALFFASNVLEAYFTDYNQTLMDAEKLGGSVEKFTFLLYQVVCGSWRHVIVFFIYYYQVVLLLAALGASALYLGLDKSGYLRRFVVTVLSGVFVFYIQRCEHRITIVTLSLLIMIEIENFTRYVKDNIVGLFDPMAWKVGIEGIKLRKYELERLEMKIELVMPQLNRMIAFIMINTMIYFTVDLWIGQCTGLHANDGSGGVSNIGLDGEKKSLWYRVFDFVFVTNMRQTRHLFYILLNLGVIIKIYQFNSYWNRKFRKMFVSNKIKVWNEICLQYTDNGNAEDRTQELNLQLLSFDSEYNTWKEYFQDNLLNTFNFKIVGIIPGKSIVFATGMIQMLVLLQRIVPGKMFDAEKLMAAAPFEYTSLQHLFCLGLNDTN